MRQLEAERGPRGQPDVFFPGKTRPACSRARAGRQSDGSPFPSAGKAADQSAECSAPAGHYSSTLAFALGGESLGSGSNRKIRAVQVDRVKAYLKFRSALESTQGLGLDDSAAHRRSTRNRDPVPGQYLFGDSAGERFTGLTQLGANGRAEPHGNRGPCGHDKRFTFPRFLAFCGLRGAVVARSLSIRIVCVSAGVGGRLATASDHSKCKIQAKGE